MFASVPAIVEDAPSSHKRRRVEPPSPDSLADGELIAPAQLRMIDSSEPHLGCDNGGATWISGDTDVCFGMVIDCPVIAHSNAALAHSCVHEAVYITSGKEVRHCANGNMVGHLQDYASRVLSKLADDEQLTLQLAFSTSPIATEPEEKPPKTVGFLSIIIYGPKTLADDVGHFLTQCGYFLQDPFRCDRNVPYLNPHCFLGLQEHFVRTFDFDHGHQHHTDDFARSPHDILAGFETADSFAETPTPKALRTPLQAHQRRALTFFMRRERGLHPSENGLAIWLRQSVAGNDNIFVNTVTGKTQSTPPPIWRGGILADEMGLGKTLSMIALIATDKDSNATHIRPPAHKPQLKELNSTLVVVPLNVLPVWESQLKAHTHPGQMTWFSHHGKNRVDFAGTACPPDIVFTTYQTIECEKRNPKLHSSSIFSCQWRRIILDEAHIIRNHKTKTATALGALHATSRWAVSGTPIQNNLNDFLGLFKFLHFEPYDDPKAFDDDISNLWRSRPVEEAIETFKRLLSCVMIRRTKTILSLPRREDKIIRVSFDSMEEEHYRRVEQPVTEMLDEVAATQSGPASVWLNAIQQINKLRLICNLGTFVPSRQSDLAHSGGEDSTLALISARLSLGGQTCEQCLQIMDSSPSGNDLTSTLPSDVYYSRCLRLFCATCYVILQYQAPTPCECSARGDFCPLRPFTPLLPALVPTPTRDTSLLWPDTSTAHFFSSKVHALLREVQAYPNEKNVIFSAWTSSLDMVQRALEGASIRCVRIDGKIPTKKREQVIQQFRNDPNTRVILITILCGACGIDLTTASRVHLLEPQWNPCLEDQALARAHRLGQTRPVTTLRYVIKNSVEEDILNVQDRKKLLATTLLSNDSSLQKLRQLVHAK